MSLITFIAIIIIKKFFADYRSFWLGDSNWVIYYCHHITGIIYFLYLLAKSGEILSGLISALDPLGSIQRLLENISLVRLRSSREQYTIVAL